MNNFKMDKRVRNCKGNDYKDLEENLIREKGSIRVSCNKFRDSIMNNDNL